MVSKLKSPDSAWVHSFLTDSLVSAGAYAIDTPDVTIKLDQNESPWDWPDDLKQAVLDKLGSKSWNRYPSAFSPRLTELVADYIGVPKDNVLLAPGSNYLCSLLLSIFGKEAKGDIVIAQPKCHQKMTLASVYFDGQNADRRPVRLFRL